MKPNRIEIDTYSSMVSVSMVVLYAVKNFNLKEAFLFVNACEYMYCYSFKMFSCASGI